MDLTLDDTALALREAVRKAAGRLPGPGARHREGAGLADLPEALTAIGAWGLPFDTALGGAGAGLVEVAVVAEALGAAVVPIPYAEVLAAGLLVAELGTPAQRTEVLGPLTDGTRLPLLLGADPAQGEVAVEDGLARGTLARLPAVDGPWTPLVVADGTVHRVLDDVVPVRTVGYDGRPLARLELAGVRVEPLGGPGHAEPSGGPGHAEPSGGPGHAAALATYAARTAVLRAHEAVGLMDTALALVLEQLHTRRQFGAALETFQTLRFRAADLYVRIEVARSLALWALLVMTAPGRAPEDHAAAASRLAIGMGDAARLVSQEAVQLHGGIGLTAEHDVSHVAARLTALRQELGPRAGHLAALATHPGPVDALPEDE
jgi:alkylation response protein AidB-like acyl-CoA dehydrogenase